MASPSSKLPEAVRALFWEYDADAINWDADRDLIIRRVLSAGSWPALQWLRARLGDAALRRWIVGHAGDALAPRQLRFWALVLDLPRERVNAWIEARRSSPWTERTAP